MSQVLLCLERPGLTGGYDIGTLVGEAKGLSKLSTLGGSH
jgi:hypothetical protein